MPPYVRMKNGVPFKDFPNELRLIDETTIHRDQTRLLLFFKKAHTIQQVKGLLQRLSPSPITRPLVLEDEATHSPRGRSSGPLQKPINHTSYRYWIRSQDSRGIGKAIIQILEASPALKLERLGPVYRIPKSESDEVLVCPLPHVLIVKPAPGIGQSQFDDLLTQLDLEEIPRISQYLSGARYCVLKPNATHTVATAQKLFLTTLRPKIKTVLFDYMPLLSPDQAGVTPQDTHYPDTAMPGQWNLGKIMADEAWGLPVTGQGVLVCHIDTNGVDVDHPDLKAAKSTAPALGDGYTFDFPNNPPPPPASPNRNGQDGPKYSHGTICAGVIAARMNNLPDRASGTIPAGTAPAEGIAGVAPGCYLLSLRTYNGNWSEWASAMGYAAQHGAKVICTCFKIDVTPAEQALVDRIIDDVFHGTGSATQSKPILVAAAGNNNSWVVDYPARHPNVIAVGASTGGGSSAEDYRCKHYDWYSSPPTSGNPLAGSNYGSQLSVVAPGMNIITTKLRTAPIASPPDIDSSYTRQFGTSLAAPHVAGLAALIIERFPTLANNPQEVINIIERTADKVHDGGMADPIDGAIVYTETASHPNGKWNQYLGYGRVNALRALTFADVLICDYPGDVGKEPSTGLDPLGTKSDIVVRPATDEVWQPQDELNETRAGQVVQGENICWVKIKNRGPAAAINVRVRAAIWPRITLNDVKAIGRRILLNPIATAGVIVSQIPMVERNFNDPVRDYLLIPSVPAGNEMIVKFRIDSGEASYAKRWADGDIEMYYDSEMGRGGTGTPRPMIIFAEVTADNDYAYQDAPKKTVQDLVIRRNNLAQRKLHFV